MDILSACSHAGSSQTRHNITCWSVCPCLHCHRGWVQPYNKAATCTLLIQMKLGTLTCSSCEPCVPGQALATPHAQPQHELLNHNGPTTKHIWRICRFMAVIPHTSTSTRPIAQQLEHPTGAPCPTPSGPGSVLSIVQEDEKHLQRGRQGSVNAPGNKPKPAPKAYSRAAGPSCKPDTCACSVLPRDAAEPSGDSWNMLSGWLVSSVALLG